jgi:hypothetical protein
MKAARFVLEVQIRIVAENLRTATPPEAETDGK